MTTKQFQERAEIPLTSLRAVARQIEALLNEASGDVGVSSRPYLRVSSASPHIREAIKRLEMAMENEP